MNNVPPSRYGQVSVRDALTVDCPKCGRLSGKRCVYLADIYAYVPYPHYSKQMKHHKGSQTQRPHVERGRAFAEMRLDVWRQEHKAEALAASRARSRQLRSLWPVWEAQAEFDRRENEALRSWLREFGEILWSCA